MRRCTSTWIGLAAVWLLPAAQPGRAAAIAAWVTPWSVTLDGKIEAGNASDRRSFGGGADGTITNVGGFGEFLPGTGALASSESLVSTAYFSDSNAQTDVTFTRDFTLSGSPTGWNVTLNSMLAGMLSAAGASYNPKAIVTAYALIVGQPAFLEPYGFSIDTACTTCPDPNSQTISVPQSKTRLLPDGTYEVKGLLLTSAQIDEGIFAGSAASKFFDTFTVSVTATPADAPEPGTLASLALGAALVAGSSVRGRRRQKR